MTNAKETFSATALFVTSRIYGMKLYYCKASGICVLLKEPEQLARLPRLLLFRDKAKLKWKFRNKASHGNVLSNSVYRVAHTCISFLNCLSWEMYFQTQQLIHSVLHV